MPSEPSNTALLFTAMGSLLALAGIASQLSGRFGIPALALFLALGIAAGSEGLGGIPFDDYELAFRLGTLALALILFDGGLNTSADVLRKALARAGLLATVSVVLTAAVVAGAALALGVPPAIALLIGAVVSSTDAAAVFSILRGSGVRLKHSTGATLEVESGLNDPMAVLLTMVTAQAVVGTSGTPVQIAWLFAQQVLFGVAGGLAVGYLGRWVLRVVVLPAAGLYPAITVALALLAFGVPTLFNGSGFFAVYLAGILLGHGVMPYRSGIRRVHDSLAWLSQIVMFLMLGLLVFPSQLMPFFGTGLVLAGVLAFVARPLAVGAVLVWFRMPWRERAFISWVGLRGAVPIVLATYPVLLGVPNADAIFHLVFFIVLVNSLVPGATVPLVARWLGLARESQPAPAASVELVSLRELPGEFVWYYVAGASAVAGVKVSELPLPAASVVSLVVRGSEVLVPRGSTELATGDEVCLFATDGCRRLLDLLFGAEPDEAD
jgi:cell volume regulation protein A